ncbi:hypothetical protein [Halalkalibacillus halophilus]|uniref:hypothetical protein n=1 Tax=Halalkalibacillus halophilus TaxID=392827 RepID=UPI000482CF49|nr:hypothetical protein [Halalkalibacillus halophilus]
MIGSIWWNILIATSTSVYVFLLSITINDPSHALVKALLFFVFSFLFMFIFRKILTFSLRNKEDSYKVKHVDMENTSNDKNDQQNNKSQSESDEIDSEQAAEAVRSMLQSDQQDES